MHPKESWVARWNSLENRVPGNYAIHIDGQHDENEDNLNINPEQDDMDGFIERDDHY